jgi:FKBP-type peptidyl-prolyl cis-trans isomerase
MARTLGFHEIAAILERKGQPVRQRLRSGLTLLVDVPGPGEQVRRQQNHRIRLKMWLNRGEGMRIGGMRRVEIAPHLAYGDRGVPGVIPPGAMLTAEITILAAVPAA